MRGASSGELRERRESRGVVTSHAYASHCIRRSPQMAIQVGAEAPDFELASSEPTDKAPSGKKIKLSDFRGKKNVVLAFYPLDFSGVCSGEMACFVTDLPEFE